MEGPGSGGGEARRKGEAEVRMWAQWRRIEGEEKTRESQAEVARRRATTAAADAAALPRRWVQGRQWRCVEEQATGAGMLALVVVVIVIGGSGNGHRLEEKTGL